MKVFVYFNLHKKCFSVKALTGENKGRVIQHTDDIALLLPEFKVSEAGRQRVLREKQKNVHAGVVGWLDVSECSMNKDYYTQVKYNPYKYYSFVTNDEKPVYNGLVAHLTVTNKVPKIEAYLQGE
jgi:hypothetical protein